jgi:hypothetical protein
MEVVIMIKEIKAVWNKGKSEKLILSGSTALAVGAVGHVTTSLVVSQMAFGAAGHAIAPAAIAAGEAAVATGAWAVVGVCSKVLMVAGAAVFLTGVVQGFRSEINSK